MVDEADEWTFFHSVDGRKARKAHRCGECGRPIEPGERYHYATGLMYSDWVTMKQCGQCSAAARWLFRVCGGFLYGAVLADLEEHWEEDDLYRSLSFGRLLISERKHWLHHGRLIPVEQVGAWVDDALSRVPALAGER